MKLGLALLLICVGCAHQIPVETEFNANDIPPMNCDTFKNQLTQPQVDAQYLICTTEMAKIACDFYHPGYNMACTEVLSNFCLFRMKMWIGDREMQYEECVTQANPKQDKN